MIDERRSSKFTLLVYAMADLQNFALQKCCAQRAASLEAMTLTNVRVLRAWAVF
jgi:hypothetical protein